MKTKFIWASLAGLLAWTVWGAEAVVVNLDDVVVPASAVTARLDSLTVSEAAITVSAESEKIRRDLIDQVRHGKTEASASRHSPTCGIKMMCFISFSNLEKMVTSTCASRRLIA